MFRHLRQALQKDLQIIRNNPITNKALSKASFICKNLTKNENNTITAFITVGALSGGYFSAKNGLFFQEDEIHIAACFGTSFGAAAGGLLWYLRPYPLALTGVLVTGTMIYNIDKIVTPKKRY